MEQEPLRLGFAGPDEWMELVVRAAETGFPEIRPLFCVCEEQLSSAELMGRLLELRAAADGVLLCCPLPAEISQTDISPCDCISPGRSSLLAALLHLSAAGTDIRRVSIDSSLSGGLQPAFAQTGISSGGVQILPGGCDSTERMDLHRSLFLSGLTAGCVTSLPGMRDRLREENIPAVCVLPSEEDICLAVSRMVQTCRMTRGEPEDTCAVLCLHLSPSGDLAGPERQSYRRAREEWQAAACLHDFAEKTGAALIQQSERHYILFTSRKVLSDCCGSSLRDLPFLQSICTTCMFDAALGAGFGTPGQALADAELALQEAVKHPGERGFIVRHTEPPEPEDGGPVTGDDILFGLMQHTGIDLQKASSLSRLLEQTGKDTFSVPELAEKMHISVRAVNHLLNILQQNGYASTAGRCLTGGPGRPGMLYRFTLLPGGHTSPGSSS